MTWRKVKQRYKLSDRHYFDGMSNKSEGTVRSSHVNESQDDGLLARDAV